MFTMKLLLLRDMVVSRVKYSERKTVRVFTRASELRAPDRLSNH